MPRIRSIAIWSAAGLGLWCAFLVVKPVAAAWESALHIAGFILAAIIVIPLIKGPSGDYSDGLHYHSTDASLVDVTLMRKFRDNDQSHFVTLHAPRAAIDYFSTGYPPRGSPVVTKGLQRVPDKIEVETVHLVLAFPNGEPFPLRAMQLGKINHTSPAQATKDLRNEETHIELTYISPDHPWEERVKEYRTLSESRGHFKIVDRYDGLEHALGDTYIGVAGVDEFVEIFANERARWVREQVCRFVAPTCI